MFKKEIVLIVLILLFCGLFDAAVAIDYADMWWRGRKDEPEKWAVDTRWNNPANWYTIDGKVHRPTSEDTVSLNGGTLDANVPYPGPNAVDPIIDSENVGDNKAVCFNLWLPYWQEPNYTDCVLWVVDGVLEVEKHFILGVSNRCDDPIKFIDHGILEMSGGTITVGQKLSVGGTGGWFCETQSKGEGGQGIINMTGGTITCGTFYIPEGNYVFDPNGGGTVNLDGGTIYADTFVMHPNDPCGSSGRMYITDGKLIIDGNQISLIEEYAGSNDWISGGEPNWVIQAIYYSDMNTNPEDMNTTRVIARNPELAWSPYPKDDTVRIEYGVTLSWLAGTKASDVNGHDVYLGTDEASVRDANVTVPLGVYRGRQTATLYNTAPLSLIKGATYYWRIDEVNNPAEIYKGRVWNFMLDDGRAYNPYPSDTATVDTIEPTLSWMPGTDSNTHDVYFGTDFDEVDDANIVSTGIFRGNYDVNSYDPGALLLGTTYYWRIDEVNTVTIKGHVWSFTTGDYFVAEDFDSYVDKNAIRAVWTTGHLTNNGAELFVEKVEDLVRDGNSMRYYFKNFETGGEYAGSEAEASTTDLEIGSDWTAIGAKALVLYFYGNEDNLDDTTGVVDGIHQDQMYVALEDGDSNEGIVKYDKKHNYDMNAIKEAEWHEWNINLQDPCLAGVNMANIAKVYIGFGGQKMGQTEDGAGKVSGKGDTVWFDDITLAASRCVADFGPQVDLSPNCYIDIDDLDILFDGWLAKGYDVQAAESIPYDPCLWYKFDETDGNEAEDSMHPGDPDYTAIYMQDPCDINDYDANRIWDSNGGYDGNGCMVFGGSDANHSMKVPSTWFWNQCEPPDGEGIVKQITISAWVKGIVRTPDVWQTLFHAKQWGRDYPCWMKGQWRRKEDFYFTLFADKDAPPGSQDDFLNWEGAEDVTEWTHFAFVKDLYADEMIMYVDGMPVAMTTTDPCQHMHGDMVQVFYIGGPADRELIDEYEPPGVNKLKYDGSYLDGSAVDDFRIYRQALSHPEILKLAGRESVHVSVVPLFSPGDPYVDDKIDLKDYALIASYWLEVPLWP